MCTKCCNWRSVRISRSWAPSCRGPPGAVRAGLVFEDSTQCRLHAKLAEDFKGSGGSASTSTVKIDLIYDYTHTVIYDLHITDGTAADLKPGRRPWSPSLRAHDLVMRDLGYFCLPPLRQIADQQAYFLSRLCKGVQVSLAANDEAPSLPLVVHLQQHFPRHTVVDLDVYVGQEDKLPCRLIAYRLPDEVVAHRRRTAHEVASKKGRTPTQAYLAWLQYGWYITNVSRDACTVAGRRDGLSFAVANRIDVQALEIVVAPACTQRDTPGAYQVPFV